MSAFVEDMCSLLASCPGLQHLALLRLNTPTRAHPDYPQVRGLPFRKLSDITLEGLPARFLRHLIRCITVTADDAVLRVSSSLHSSLVYQGFHELLTHLTPVLDTVVASPTGVTIIESRHPAARSYRVVFEVTYDIVGQPWGDYNICQLLGKLPSITRAEITRLDDETQYRPDSWFAFFGAVPALEELTLDGGNVYKALYAQDPRNSPAMLCRKLRRLTIVNPRLSLPDNRNSALQGFLASRCTIGRPLGCLTLNVAAIDVTSQDTVDDVTESTLGILVDTLQIL